MDNFLAEIKQCRICDAYLNPRPVLKASKTARVAIIGQAPGTKVHASGIPWDDQSGKQLRKWLNISEDDFYDASKVAIVPMGFCYPGKGKTGDLPPRPECAPKWHQLLWDEMPQLEFIILIGQYAQKYYLQKGMKKNLTETVMHFEEYLPKYFVLPHPSPRNRFWFTKNTWFEKAVLPVLKKEMGKQGF